MKFSENSMNRTKKNKIGLKRRMVVSNIDRQPHDLPTKGIARLEGGWRRTDEGLGGNHQPIRVQMFSYGDYKPFPPSAGRLPGVLGRMGPVQREEQE